MSTTSEIGSTNKLGKWVIICIVVMVVPSVLMSEYCLEKFQAHIAKNFDKDWAPGAQKWVAYIYGHTMRHERAAERYGFAATLYAERRDYTTAGELLYAQAHELESANKKYEALPIYERVEEEYKEYPVGARAHGAVVRLKLLSRP